MQSASIGLDQLIGLQNLLGGSESDQAVVEQHDAVEVLRGLVATHGLGMPTHR